MFVAEITRMILFAYLQRSWTALAKMILRNYTAPLSHSWLNG
jgi:hypothetical protein